MNYAPHLSEPDASPISAQDWPKVLAPYRQPDEKRSVIELAVTAALFAASWIAAWLAFSVSYWLALALCVPAAGFMVRLFMIQHDCGHGAFFKRRTVNDWVGRVIGALLMTPYHVWRSGHAIHHATSGNLAERGMGDVDTLTVREYRALSRFRRLAYRLYRHPVVMFGIGPAYLFLLRHRLPFGFMGAWRYWISAMGTNVAIVVSFALMIYLVGAAPFLLIHLPIVLMAASIGVWLFYVQHQFEDTFWAEDDSWQFHHAALHGSSHYDLPGVLRWFTANIGVHHIHHLSSRIPYYRLPQVLRDFPELSQLRRLTLKESLSCIGLHLWDESSQKLVSFRAARASA